ncbi:hypothetical protein MIND_00291900 [Mycena indigotica]|uniref:Uncharacterized protein n=1 Tax=Mycena indigotica TaxID=2126181 RepID=A0A8H6WFD2_9AGAR|nr:uncharacterized protein MIND_00291900 [Mycena indigotica]KAF7312768.1 hypothetical protein MIND_00291900 [Mycena indigotica]
MSELTDEEWASLLGEDANPGLNDADEDSSDEEEDSDNDEPMPLRPQSPTVLLSEEPPAPDNMPQRVKQALAHLSDLGLDFTTFVDAVLWGNEPCRRDSMIRGTRTNFMNSPSFPKILARLWDPPRQQKDRPSRLVMENFVQQAWSDLLVQELNGLAPFFSSKKGEDVTVKALTSLNFTELTAQVQERAPHLWKTLLNLAMSEDQKRNTHKNPSKTIIMILAMLSYSRSHKRNLF